MKGTVIIIGFFVYVILACFICWVAILFVDLETGFIRTRIFWNSFLLLSVCILSIVPAAIGYKNKKYGTVAGFFLPFIGGLLVVQVFRTAVNLSSTSKLNFIFYDAPNIGDYSIILTPIVLSWIIGPFAGGLGELLSKSLQK